MSDFQSNTDGAGSSPLSASTGNSFLDGLNATIGVIGNIATTGAGVYGDITDAKTQREIALLNARSDFATASSPSEFNPVLDTKGLEKVMFTLGIGMLAFVAVTAFMSRKR